MLISANTQLFTESYFIITVAPIRASSAEEPKLMHIWIWQWHITYGIWKAKAKRYEMSGYYRREAGGVDGEEGDAIDFGSENSELGVEGGEREAAVTGRELMRLVLVVIEWVLGWECYSKCEPIGSLDLGVTTRLVQPICVVCIKCLHHHHHQQQHCQHCHCYCHWINAYQLTLLFHTFLSWLFLAVMLLMESGVYYKDTVLCCVVLCCVGDSKVHFILEEWNRVHPHSSFVLGKVWTVSDRDNELQLPLDI